LNISNIFEGWHGYQVSLQNALERLTPSQLDFRPARHVRSLGEIFRHLALGRITWLARIPAPGIDAVEPSVHLWFTDGDGGRHVVEESVPANDPHVLSGWLLRSWNPIAAALSQWTIDDLFSCYPHRFRGTDFRISRQWTLWRVLSHDTHHGGQIALLLAMQNIEAFELRALGGHIVSPPVAS